MPTSNWILSATTCWPTTAGRCPRHGGSTGPTFRPASWRTTRRSWRRWPPVGMRSAERDSWSKRAALAIRRSGNEVDRDLDLPRTTVPIERIDGTVAAHSALCRGPGNLSRLRRRGQVRRGGVGLSPDGHDPACHRRDLRCHQFRGREQHSSAAEEGPVRALRRRCAATLTDRSSYQLKSDPDDALGACSLDIYVRSYKEGSPCTFS